MSTLDWYILAITLVGIVLYGLYKSTATKNIDGYFRGNQSMPWYLVLLGIVGTQASAITFISAPGQAFTDGMRFVQYYFGLPLAMIVICIFFVPKFQQLNVYTAYEYLEQRFNKNTRTFTAFLFLLGRGLSTGVSIYAPSLILSSLFGWNIFVTNCIMGGIVIIYTVSGGAKAVAYTQQLQLLIIFSGLAYCGYYLVSHLPENYSFNHSLRIAGLHEKMNIITTGVSNGTFQWKDKYNIVSGLVGGFFLALSYFGTDQSQVGRYLSGKNIRETKLGLLMNGVVKIPMQLGILLLGILLLAYYQFAPQPIFYNTAAVSNVTDTAALKQLWRIEKSFGANQQLLAEETHHFLATSDATPSNTEQARALIAEQQTLRKQYKQILTNAGVADTNDTNYIFLHFIKTTLPSGLVGLLIAIIFLAAWGSIAAALNALASSTLVDFVVPFSSAPLSEKQEYVYAKWITLAWGIFCVIVAQFSSALGSLIEAVNILGSLFYGVILGIFLVAFMAPKVTGKTVFTVALISEFIVVLLFTLDYNGIIGLGFLWLNVVGALLVYILSLAYTLITKSGKTLSLRS
ncbi:MAG: sodium:solute symporter [Bacteroidetes bacterium]|nr:MAG: sodium:solute symporter [Bacteroidota bacterium]